MDVIFERPLFYIKNSSESVAIEVVSLVVVKTEGVGGCVAIEVVSFGAAAF